MTLRTKTFIILIFFITPIIVISGILSLSLLEKSIREFAHDGLNKISEANCIWISKFLDDTLKDTEAIASSLPEKALYERNISVIEGYLKSKFNIYSKFSNGMFILDEKGNLWVDYPPHLEIRGKNFAHREYFKTTMERQRGIIGIPYRSARTGEPVITFTAILRNSKKHVIGLLGCSVQLLHSNALGGIRKMKIGDTGYISVFDPSGLIVLHPEDSMVLQKKVPKELIEYLKTVDRFKSVEKTINLEGIPVLFSIGRIPETNWIVVAQQTEREAFNSIYEMRKKFILIGFAVLLISMTFAAIAIQRVTHPLRKLRETISKYGEDPESIYLFSEREHHFRENLIRINPSDEIGGLTQAFKTMYERLGQTLFSLKETIKDWERAFNTVQEPIFLLDKDHRILRLNRSAADLIGLPIKEIIGQTCYKLIHRTEAPPNFCPYLQTLTACKPIQQEIEIEEPLLRGIFEITISPVVDKNSIIGAVHIMKDITSHKRAEMSLEASEVKYKTLVESLSDALLMLDNESNILSCNQAFCNLFGYERKEIEGKPIRILHPSNESFYSFNQLVYPIVKENGLFRIEWNLRCKDGKEVPVEITTSLIKSVEGAISGYVNIIRDMSERKKVEQEKSQLEEQFRQAQKMEAVGRFAGGIAHDFNNLLTVIQGNCDISLLELNDGNPLKYNIEQIRAASQKASDLTRQLLAFSRRQQLDPKVLDLNAIIKNLDKMLHRIIGEDVKLITILSEELGKIKADRSQIEQVILNLVVNARDAMPDGGTLIIETSNVELNEMYTKSHIDVISGHYVLLSVTDNGVGMSQEIKEKIFEPFFTTKEKGKGTGLGLSTVYGIVKQSGGNIWVYSEPGKGTTFKIYLPRVDEYIEEVKEGGADEIPKGSETILVVEDDETVRGMATRILSTLGYRVLDASEAKEAVRLLEEHRGLIDLIITDVVMPTMNGKQLIDHLRFTFPNLKVLFMSGYTDSTIAYYGILEEGINFIQKPFTLNTLAKKVREILDFKKSMPVYSFLKR